MPDYRLAARRAAARYRIDPKVFEALIQTESGFREGVSSPAGARDIAQFIPSTAKAYGVTLGDNKVTDDLEGAARYLADNLKRTGGDYKAALSIYNSGRPDGYKSIPETQNYVRRILGMAGGEPAGGAASSGSGGTTTTRTTPGVDQSGARGQAIAQWLLSGKKANPLELVAQLQGLKDKPATSTSTTTPGDSSSAPVDASGGGRSGLLELFWQGANGINVKNGQVVPQGFVSGHQDHVHVAAGPKTVVAIGRLAQSMGLNVGENPHFGTVHPVHVSNSYHYKGEAIDVSGDPQKMAAFAHRVAKSYGL